MSDCNNPCQPAPSCNVSASCNTGHESACFDAQGNGNFVQQTGLVNVNDVLSNNQILSHDFNGNILSII
jgi:hypothetical protein